ncbi:unnamed protein product [Clonostachys byssicola]|uniref:Uncharacterized protein n=1 Tax=Clonostachys byssicola TaxID=160290 RepID=A0A9N9Y4Y9_9HYPO|nr:unnamed protein product [Clonostachys byssicola]
MSIFESLPYDVLIAVGNACKKSDLSNLAKANHLCYDLFNQLLYSRNAKEDAPHQSCIFFAIQSNNIHTIRKALELGADVNTRALAIPAPFLFARREEQHAAWPYDGEMLTLNQVTWNHAQPAREEAVVADNEIVTANQAAWNHPEPAEDEEVDADEDGSLMVAMSDIASVLEALDMTEDVVEMQAVNVAAPKLSYTPLQCATFFRRREIVECLLQHGADLHATAQGSCDCLEDADSVSALHIALSHGQGHGDAVAIARIFIERGARDSAKGHPAIFEIVANAEVELFDVMLNRHEVDIHATDKSGRNLLHLAVDSSDGACLPLCRRLLDRGVDANHIDNMGRTPFSSMATSGEFVPVAILLLERGANPTLALVHDNGTRPRSMLDACTFDIEDYPSGVPWQGHDGFVREQKRRTQLVKLLLERGIPPNPRQGSRSNHKALTRALFGAAAHLRDVNCMQMLIDAGARADSTIGRAFYRDKWSLLVALVKHEARKWGFLTFDDIPEEISMINRIRLLLDNGAPLGPVKGAGEQSRVHLFRRPLDGGDEAEGGEFTHLVHLEDESDEEFTATWDAYSIQGLGSGLFEFSTGTASSSAMEVAFELAASDKKVTFRPEVGFQLNDIFLDIFCDYATSRNITEEHLSDLIEDYDEEEHEDASPGKKSSGRHKAAWDKLVQLRDRLYPGHHST